MKEKTYNIVATFGDRRILRSFQIKGKTGIECYKKAKEEFDSFKDSLELELES